jgi:hypothetical protein
VEFHLDADVACHLAADVACHMAADVAADLDDNNDVDNDVALLMVNFRQHSYEFTFNVGVDLLF